ncbi:MAG: type I 3-dehydroquinate dehydratase [Cellulomonas iranensis]|uniref:type I 3-dehydroquinate dehydratase n=1 Tax=Cellulomonas iranensis TaxID=76862 RepID=UPI001B04AFBD|nr:type I 3-dehydroquinate dehydratase [Cellulomonas iranensis]MBO9570191.1 type I 3-dehydroquinate dehydratase [Cellulomonas iranensis]
MTTNDGRLRLRGTTLGSGVPKVCVPVVAATPDAAVADVRALPTGVADVVELRLDHLVGAAGDPAVARHAVRAVRAALPPDVPLLATFRSAREGGAQPADDDAYTGVVRAALAADGADAVDVELAARDAAALVADAHGAGLAVVVSQHDFAATPPADDLVATLRRQRDLGADVCKVAVTPHDADDVLTLLTATRAFARDADRPVVTIAMGGLGVVTRVAGEVFGSAMTFGTVGAASAPGQVDAVRLRAAMGLLHDAL